ncbi:MAG: hypothetical protein OER88_06140 [Planctomycetota bacterium]|nr:hypothetical protein [Planctomycetota bacterium]
MSSRSIEHEQVKGAWTGTIGASDVHVELRVFSGERFRFFQPGAVTRMLAANRAEREGGFRFATRELVDGPFGAEPFASVCSGPIEGGSVLTFGGLLDGKSSYSIVIEARPALSDADRKVAIAMVKNGIEVVCNPVDPRWTEKEAQARWNAAVRDEATRKGLRKVRRTKHYIIFTNSSGGALFAKKMEQYYKTIQKTFPFAERKARRLMPVFLLRTREEYVKFTVHNARMNMAQAAATKGHAFLDYYATYYESPNDPVHIHEATHQIFKNRLHLDGGGSWFQEGVAEYMSTRRSARKAWARRAARDDKHVGFRDFVTIRTLIANPYTDGKSAYLQAASLIDFLRDGKWQRDKFPAFLEEIGTLRRADADAIEAKLKAIYGTELQGLEEAWQKHWKR